MTDDDRAELRTFASHVVHEHDPANQNHRFERCELCGFVRHPCETYELADAVLELLDG
jgi:hypothetical protein